MKENKKALITGAAVGIGRATAIKFAQNGIDVALWDINEEKLSELKEELSCYGVDVIISKCDVSDEEQVNTHTGEIIKKWGKIDILVNNAAVWRCWKQFVNVPTDEWKKFIDINIMGVVYCTRAVLPYMVQNNYGSIINVSSVAGVYGNANMVHYSATKGAVIAMTKALAKEVADKGVRVNSVSPGTVSPSENEDVDYCEASKLSYMGRTGTDMENANLIYFLATDGSGYISGQNILIDGCRKNI